MKRILCLLLAVLLLTGCAPQTPRQSRYETSFLDVFDTVTSIVGFAESEEAFLQTAQTIHDELLVYHRLYDIYHEYPDLTNLKTLNEQAGGPPVQVDRKILDLLQFCKDMEQATGGAVNAAMGSVLSLWHEARTAGLADPAHAALPDSAALQAAAAHTDFSCVILDEAASTVCITDPELRLDVGAVAKGYAVQQVCRNAPAGLLVSVGGNVCATGPKPDGSSWVVGLQDPDSSGSLCMVNIPSGSVVTSGSYQRFYTVDGIQYHHIIDPETQMPAETWRAVSILCADSGVADALSTALFLLDQEAGQALLDAFDAEAFWLDHAGNRYFSAGFPDFLQD